MAIWLVALGATLCAQVASYATRLPIWLVSNDWSHKDSQPKNFRKLDFIHASGSAEFSAAGLAKILAELKPRKVTVVDLRQESHGFMDDLPISWYQGQNQINWGRSLAEIETDERLRLKQLQDSQKATVYELRKPKNKSEYKTGIDPKTVRVGKSQSERQVCGRLGAEYVRIPVADYHAPDPQQVDSFVNLIKSQAGSTWLHFHCAAGEGRTTTFLAMYDMMKNAGSVPLEEIIRRQNAAGGIDLNSEDASLTWKVPYTKARKQFVKRFYDYCLDQKSKNFATAYSLWQRQAHN